jgi:hypothetical protein
VAPGDEAAPARPLVPVPWLLLSVGADDASLLVKYYTSKCRLGTPVVSTEETAENIRVSVAVPDHDHDPAQPCPLASIARNAVGRLQGPIGGRPIDGPLSLLADRAQRGAAIYRAASGGGKTKVVPKVIGLSLETAQLVLRSQDLVPEVTGAPGGIVVAQVPEPGQRLDGSSSRTPHVVSLVCR